ncbi:MAG: hypothetical protein ACLFPS_07080 [Clostridia bacterium]
MSKKISLLLILILIFSLLVACSPEEAIDQDNQDPVETPDDEAEDPDEKEEDNPDGNLEEEEPINTLYLSVFMTKKDVIELVGNDYSLTTEEEPGGMSYYSTLEYDGITFYYTHQEDELLDDAVADLIEITSNKYSYDFELEIGGSLLEAIGYCEKNFENTFDVHSGKEIFNMFNYTETQDDEKEETGYVLRLEHDSEEYYESKEELTEDIKLNKVSLFIPLN